MQPPAASTSERVIESDASPVRVGLAWGVHLFTASGAVVGTLALVAIANAQLRVAALLMLLAFVIDAADGSLARAVGVARALPWIDGRRLDDMVDYLNYVVVPGVFMVAANSLPHWTFVAVPVLASCYGFSHVAAKTADGFFLGFPSYWNIVAIYAWGLGLSPATGGWVVGFLALMVFVPLKYAYPSQLTVLRATTAVLGVLWCLALALCVLYSEHVRGLHLFEATLAFPAYYLALSFWLGRRSRRKP